MLLEVWGNFAEAFYGISLKVARVFFNTAADATHRLWHIVILQYLDLALSKCLQRRRNRLLCRLSKAVPRLDLL